MLTEKNNDEDVHCKYDSLQTLSPAFLATVISLLKNTIAGLVGVYFIGLDMKGFVTRIFKEYCPRQTIKQLRRHFCV